MVYKVVMTAKAFHDLLLHIGVDVPTEYNNDWPYNLGYHHANGKFSWDCWNLPKSLIWGWKESIPVGKYQPYNPETGLGDWGGAKIMSCCTDVSSDWTNVPVGAFLLTPKGDHAGIYIGEHIINSKCYNVVECTTSWKANSVTLSYVSSTGLRYHWKDGAQAPTRWAKHGKLPWIDYTVQPEPPTPPTPPEEPIYYTVVRGDALYKIAVSGRS